MLRIFSIVGISLALIGAGVAYAQAAATVGMVDYAFQPATLTVAPGSVTFDLRNDGRFPHNMQIEGMAEPLLATDLTAGQSGSATVTLVPGTYTFWCPVPGHRERGMEGTLVVAGAARAGGLDPMIISGATGLLGAGTLGLGLWRRRRTTQ
jgi:plastocyanin